MAEAILLRIQDARNTAYPQRYVRDEQRRRQEKSISPKGISSLLNSFLSLRLCTTEGTPRSLFVGIGPNRSIPLSSFYESEHFINLASFFNIFLLNIAPMIRPYTAIAGALYMTYLGIVFLIQPEEKDMQKKELSYIQGILLQFINPKALLYAITVYSTFIIPNVSSKGVIFLFGIFLAATAFTATSLWAMFGAVFQRFLKKFRRPFNITMAILLFYSAASIFGLLDII